MSTGIIFFVDLSACQNRGLASAQRAEYETDRQYGNSRITFGRLEGDAIDVDLEDYH
jgi:hypothetical protein